MTDLYRTMRRDADGGPAVGRSARALGVRTEGDVRDVTPVTGCVLPGAGGMSVAVGSPEALPPARRPVWVRREGAPGRSEDTLWRIAAAGLPGPPVPGDAEARIAELAQSAARAIESRRPGDVTPPPEIGSLAIALRATAPGHRPLQVRCDTSDHGLVEPSVPRSVEAYEADIAASRDDWQPAAGPVTGVRRR
ncbi:MAG: hypothetical protein K8T90_16885 [Planctomycetes bacterium]|nr:hypothetical protein [Planctomycetota bacterium]